MPSTPRSTPDLYFFFFNDTATTEIYTLSLHDALPISARGHLHQGRRPAAGGLRHPHPALGGTRGRGRATAQGVLPRPGVPDRKSTRLNSSHANISYAVFCLKQKNNQHQQD